MLPRHLTSRRKMRLFLTFLLAHVLLIQPAALATEDTLSAEPAWEASSFRIEDSRCFVGLAPVYLSVSELKPENGQLIGYYTIRVPLMSSKNDHGKIILPLEVTVRELGANGGILEGEAHSKIDDGIINQIVCKVIPEKNQTIKLAITTKDRTVNFKSRYSIIESSPPESDS